MRPATMRPTTMRPTTMRPATMRPATMRPATMRPATMRPATMRPATMRPATMRPATMRRIDLQIVRWRCRAQAPAPARSTAVSCRGIAPDGDPHSGAQHQHPPDTLLPGAARWSHAPRSGLPPRSRAGKHTRGWLDHPSPTVRSRSKMVGLPKTGRRSPNGGAAARRHPLRSIDVHVVRVVQPRCPPFSATHALAETDMPGWQGRLPGATVTV